MSYRKLTEQEIYRLPEEIEDFRAAKCRVRLNNPGLDLLSMIEAYYPPGAVKVRFECNSEYNDEGYDNTVTFIAVLDDSGREIAPLSGFERKARKAMSLIPFNTPTSEAPLEDYEQTLKPEPFVTLPELYIKES